MRLFSRCLLIVSAGCLFTGGCHLPQERYDRSTPSVIRVLPKKDGGKWGLSINGGPQRVISSADLKRRIVAIALGYGDLVLCEKDPKFQSSQAGDSFRWLLGLCNSNKVAFYVCSSEDVKNSDIFSIPVYHWVAPYSSPTRMDASIFFFEGSPMGQGTIGFRNMLAKLEHSCPTQVFILGSAIPSNYEGPPLPSPYLSLQAELDKVLEGCGTQQLLLDDMSSMPP
jgi:hypothetical protein